MGEEVLVFGGENRVADDRGNVPILHNLAMLFCEFDQQPSVGVVDMSNGRKLKTGKGFDVRQVGPVEVDVTKSHNKHKGNNYGCGASCNDYNANCPTQPA